MATETNTGLTYQEAGSLQTDVLQNAELNLFGPAVAGTVTREFATDANITLVAAEYWTSVLVLTDSPTTLTTGRDVIFPAHFPQIFVKNSTAQTLTLKKSGQTGITVAAGGNCMVASGTTDVERASGGSSTVSSVNGQSGAVTGVTSGKHAVPVMAGAMTPSSTGGCATLATIASAANQPDIQSLDFDATTEEYAQFAIPMPKSWNEGTLTVRFRWSHSAAVTNFGVVWAVQAVAVSDDDTIAVNFGTAQTVTDTGGTTNDLYISSETSALTVAGTPAAGDTVFFRVYRKAADGSDTLAVDARLHGVDVFVTTDADNDA